MKTEIGLGKYSGGPYINIRAGVDGARSLQRWHVSESGNSREPAGSTSLSQSPPDFPRVLQTHPESSRRAQSPPDSPRVLQTHPESSRRTQSPPDSPRVLPTHPESSRRTQSPPDTPRVLQTRPESSRHTQSPPDAPRVLQTHPESSRRAQSPPDTPKSPPDAPRVLQTHPRVLQTRPESSRRTQSPPDTPRVLQISRRTQRPPDSTNVGYLCQSPSKPDGLIKTYHSNTSSRAAAATHSHSPNRALLQNITKSCHDIEIRHPQRLHIYFSTLSHLQHVGEKARLVASAVAIFPRVFQDGGASFWSSVEVSESIESCRRRRSSTYSSARL